MINKLFAVLTGLFLITDAFAVSRVGTASIGSERSGFVTEVPYPFVEILQLRDDDLQIKSIVPELQLDPQGNLIQSFVEASEFDKLYPELQFQTPESAKAWAVEKGWKTVAHSNPCIVAAMIANGKSLTAIATWGPQTGVVFRGFDRSSVHTAVMQILKDIRLKEGACQW